MLLDCPKLPPFAVDNHVLLAGNAVPGGHALPASGPAAGTIDLIGE